MLKGFTFKLCDQLASYALIVYTFLTRFIALTLIKAQVTEPPLHLGRL